ncbi:MAG: extracellular solute-binding protein [Symbiobacteriaceae bacterium]|nr:extracellular solute-binding protein [Symbiobacteriaceae bacterium]
MFKKALVLCLVLAMLPLFGCVQSTPPTPTASAPTTPPTAPPEITVTVWHYFGGDVQKALDAIVEDFNNGPGKEAGITVIAENQGNTADLEKKIQSASDSGTKDLPEIVHGYPDIMATLYAKDQLASVEDYLSAEAIAGYIESYIAEGSQYGDGKLYLVPIAKSTELLFYNKTRWDAVKEEIGCTDDDLKTWEGIAKAGKAYVDAYDLAFFSIGSFANFFYLTGFQQGVEYIKDEKATLNREAAERTFSFIAEGVRDGWMVIKDQNKRYPSDWINDGTCVAYVDSNSGTTYVNPRSVGSSALEDLGFMSYPVWSNVVNRSVIQQGAGMAVVAKGEAHERASAIFLAYLTNPENTARFSMYTGYIPVHKASADSPVFAAFLDGKDADGSPLPLKSTAADPRPSSDVARAVKASIDQFGNYKMYYTPAFDGSNLIRRAVDDEVTKIFTSFHTEFTSFADDLEAQFIQFSQGR